MPAPSGSHMSFTNLPVDEVRRLAALDQLEILDTDFEPAYDAIVRRAAEICEVPMSSITLIDRDRQWHKAMMHIAEREAPREITFCAHTILQDGMLVVEDARLDDCFHDNPFVTGAPRIRFYAGVPLRMPGGEAVGTLCVMGLHPKQLTDGERAALQDLAQQAMTLFDLRARTRHDSRG
ncbi:MAG: sensor diguanylate cyclase [Gemmatimonadetes bacterium]|nr:sensor diguanylate cyclase [Gemmatimonadota bacterium]